MIVSLDDHREVRMLSLDELRRMGIVSPSIQRAVDARRVDAIVDDQKRRRESGAGLFFAGSLILWQAPGGYLVIDGQHRLEAMRQLHVLDPGYLVVVEILKDPPGLTVQTAFQLVNNGQPVPDYILAFAANQQRRPVLEEFGRLFERKYRKYVSRSQRPNRPNVNVTQLLDRINESPLADLFRDAADLMAYVDHANAYLTYQDPRVSDLADKKADGGPALYLRADVDYEWLRHGDIFANFRAPSRATMDIDFLA